MKNKGSIKILIGISNSGKSTYSHEQWLKNPENTIIVNRDAIRYMFGYTEETISEYYSRPDFNKREKQVTKYEDTLINEGLCEGKTVIIDSTHLSKDYITRHAYWNVPIDIIWFDITLKEALTRDMSRQRKVGEDVINKQYGRYVQLRKDYEVDNIEPVEFVNNEILPSCVIYDVDSTLATMSNRSPYDWDRVDEDLPVNNVVATIDWIERSDIKPKVIIVSGRDAVCYDKTHKWLKENNIYFDELIMRNEGDSRPDWVVKEEIWRTVAQNYYIVGMYDDRNQVVRRARSLGLKVFQVEYNGF